MSDPVLVGEYGNAFIYYTCDRDPTSSEPLIYNGYSDLLLLWWNQTTNSLFWLVNDTANSLIWEEQVFTSSLPSILSSLGWSINTNRSYSSRGSPAFNTSYTPSSTNDTMVSAIVNCVSTLVTPGTVLFQVNTGSGFITIGEFSISGVAASNFGTITCLVPADSQYKLLNSSGTATIISLNEISL